MDRQTSPMTAERWMQLKKIFAAVEGKPPGEQAEMVCALAQGDEELESAVRDLLAADESAGSFLETPAADLHSALLAPGTRLGPYQILGLLGEGGMGKVYRGLDTRLNRSVAIKISAEQFSKRFELEARAISALNHPNICTLYDVGPNYLVTELVEGETLRDWLQHTPALERRLETMRQVLEALRAAHCAGIVHRDLKPQNIMVRFDGYVKVLDFGLAKQLPTARAAPRETIAPPDASVPGQIVGTVAYMSPEQIQGHPVDQRSDLFAVGIILFEMLTGQHPWPRASVVDTLHAILHDDPPAVDVTTPSGAQLVPIVSKLLCKNPAERYSLAEGVLEALSSCVVPQVTSAEISSPREQEAGRKRSPWPKYATAAVAVLVLAAGAVFFWQRRTQAKPLTDKDVLVLANFANTTGDPVFDGTLHQAVAIQLEQSPFLKIMDDEQVHQNLRLMSLPPEARITDQIAHDICVRDGAAGTIEGSIASLGKSYVVTLQAITCPGGATLAREQTQADDKEHVLNAVGTAATAMRAKLGESRSSIQKLNRPLEEATTGSLEALQNYTEGRVLLDQGRFLAARPLFERATALDPNFAMAYYYIGVAFDNAGDSARTAEYWRKAFALIDRVSEYERVSIAGGYYDSTGELDKEMDAYRLGAENYPRAWGFPNNLSQSYINLGEFEEGLKEGQAANQLQPNAEPPYRRLLDAYLCLDRLDEARKVAERVRMQGIDGARIHQRFLEMAYVEGDQVAVSREIQWYAGKPVEYLSLGLQAAHLNVLGRRRESSELYQRAAETALRQGFGNVASDFEEADARADALAGNCETVHRLGRPALALALCGDAAKAEKLAAETSQRFPNGTLWNTVQLPGIRAAVELHQGQPARAVELLASASPYERAYPEAVYLRGLAYLRLRKGAEAAAEFQKIVDHKGASWASTWRFPNWGLHYSISYLGLARAYELAGDTVKARKAFQDFFALWKDADQDLPILRHAQAEYARLQ
jgi:serine/threonine protein kinase/tetratricopeptide (TPR) repeat protein